MLASENVKARKKTVDGEKQKKKKIQQNRCFFPIRKQIRVRNANAVYRFTPRFGRGGSHTFMHVVGDEIPSGRLTGFKTEKFEYTYTGERFVFVILSLG